MPGANRPGGDRGPLANRPGGSRPGGGAARPGGRPAARPTPGDVGDFLGLDKPVRPGRPSTLPGDVPGGIADRPGAGNRPSRPGNRPGAGDRPNRPGDGSGIVDRPNRPGTGDRPDRPGTRPNRPGDGSGIVDRPNRPGGRPARPGDRPGNNRPNFNDRWPGNNVINQRPGWANIGDRNYVNINNRWNNAIVRPVNPGWRVPPRGRMGYWHGWGNGVRHHWNHYHHHGGWFNASWWGHHRPPMCGWHYQYWNHNHGWNYWWTVPTFAACTNWFTWSAPANVWSEPVYYDYGAGGNVVYEDNSVYIGGTEVATADEFAASAMDLATVEPPATEEEAAEAEWMPLGTFAVSTSAKDTSPSMTVQLAVDRNGIVSGTLYNIDTDEAQTLQGQVDRETQRVAMRIGENEDLVAETGLYNLTQDEAPVLVHFGTDSTENYLLVRLEDTGDASPDE